MQQHKDISEGRPPERWAIVDYSDRFLAAGRASAGGSGIARVWSPSERDALTFASDAEAQVFIDREFSQQQINGNGIHPSNVTHQTDGGANG